MTAPRPDRALCRGRRVDGSPCRAFGRRPDGFCPWHRPDGNTQAHRQLTQARARLRELRGDPPADPVTGEVVRFRQVVREAYHAVRRLAHAPPGTPLSQIVQDLDAAFGALKRARARLALDHPDLAAADREDQWRACVV